MWRYGCVIVVGLLALTAAPAWADTVLLSRAHALAVEAPPPQEPGAAHGLAVTLPHRWADSFPGYSGVVSYRVALPALPALPAQGLLGVYIPRVCSNVEVFLNGELMASGGQMKEPVTRNCYYPQLFSLPPALLRSDANELRLDVVGFAEQEVSARPRAGGLSAVQVGPMAQLEPLYARHLFWTVTVAQIGAATIGLLGLAVLGLAVVRRKDTHLLYFGLFMVGWALVNMRLFVRAMPLGNQLVELLSSASFVPVVACGSLFLLRLVKLRNIWLDGLLWLQVLGVVPLLVWVGDHNLLRVSGLVYNLLTVEFALCAAVFCVVSWRRHREQFWLVGGVLVVAAVLVALKVATDYQWAPLPDVHLGNFAIPFIFLAIGVRMIQLFAGALARVESTNRQLELRVAMKTSEIEMGYKELAELRAREAARHERFRIAADLHDDLGARLLSMAQSAPASGPGSELASMAREALDEMRLSVRGITGETALAADVLADWRAEMVSRLTAAGFTPVWEAEEPEAGLIFPARTHVQLTRVLREAESNVIRHSGGSRCRVRVRFAPPGLCLTVEDDGQGLAGAALLGAGHGLPNIERRVRKLAGRHDFSTSPLGGAKLSVSVPLDAEASGNISGYEVRPDR